jgi:ribosomal protein S18 acetylase RimI-like enzyme
MSIITIRQAVPTDATSIVSLHAYLQTPLAEKWPWRFKSIDSDFDRDYVLGLMEDLNNTFVVADIDRHVRGYALIRSEALAETPLTYAYKVTRIAHISVAPKFRGMGIGTNLLSAIKMASKEKDIPIVELEMWIPDERTRNFFHRNGFDTCKERLWTV